MLRIFLVSFVTPCAIPPFHKALERLFISYAEHSHATRAAEG